MMDRLREGVNSLAVKIILGIIILSFIFAGVGSYLVGGGANSAATVGNTEIGRGEFEQAYQNERNRMQSQLGDYFSAMLGDPAYVASFRQSVLDRMVNDVLIEQHAEKLGLRVSDDQVRQLMLDMPQFQSNGQFDSEIYQAALRRAGFTPDSFAEYLRRDLVRNQLLSGVQGSEFSLEGEVELQTALVGQTRDIRKVVLSLEDFAQDVELTDEEISDYYQQNAQRYTRPEQFVVSYLELDAQVMRNSIDVSDQEIADYYEQNIDKYSSDEQRSISHILVQDEAAADEILAELNGGADFAALAEEKSEDFGSSEEGGSLGWIERGVMDPAFEDAAFDLTAEGDISGVVKSDFGFHIIKLDALKDSEAKPLEEVTAEIKQELIDQQAIDEFYNLQSDLERISFEFPDSLDDAAQAVGVDVVTTDFISQADAPEVLLNPAVMQAILSPEVKEDGLNSEVIEVAPEHVIVVRVEDMRDEMVLPLEEVKEQVEVQLARVKGEQAAAEVAQTVLEALQAGNTSALAENGLTFGDVETIDRRSPIANTVFAMTKPEADQMTYAKASEMNGDLAIVELAAVNVDMNPQIGEQVAYQLIQTNAQQDLQGLIEILRDEISIEYYINE
ncbi:peptidylprolyl isomerase [Vibrio agarivorans]|uniref:Periplasmic chaperone PpiD n=1 Tax=Vibrio agarivorans TaxID=153622 RepID=A0ABT7Y6S2_9VIBR|nr:peptidylprolyl isomerase [Vibrio agarivorans]MDN2483650.1 peptidylprolyl isomerase [Vibrio agarivorans]